MKPFFISIPHAGEKVPTETPWLKGLPEPTLMCDVDRYVDQLYQPVVEKLHLPLVKTEWHRYAVDLNRLPEDVDADSVEGHFNPAGTFPLGLHWVKTTTDVRLMKAPISKKLHEELIHKYFEPFHAGVRGEYARIKALGAEKIYQLDAHSMPSKATAAHKDAAGSTRPQVVVSDVDGTSCEARYKDLVISAYERAGFQVSYNWPYKGGRVTQTYGKPNMGQHAIQVELNRSLYQNEVTKRPNDLFFDTQKRLEDAVGYIFEQL